MSEELVKKVQEQLKEESWTRAAISNVTQNNIEELEKIVAQAVQENAVSEIREVCDEHLTHSKDSITALYISGMLALKQGALDNSALVSLVDIFNKNKKEPIVVYICKSILASDENNKFALRALAERYREDKNDEMWALYEKIVKIDFEEAEMAKALAEHCEEKGDTDNAISFYKKALHRFVSLKNISSVKEVWSKLVALIPQEIDFFLSVQRKVSKSISEDKSALLMQELYGWYKDNKKWEIAINILKLILQIDPKDSWARREIVDCYKGLYAGRANLDEYIASSDLTQGFRNVFEAISDFEKHIAFDVKSFVYHRSWGVGKITESKNDTLTINFGKKTGVHEMSLKMAVDALTPLKNDHIWVLKRTKTRETLVKMVKENKAETLKTIIKSFGNSCDFKRIKAELVPSILQPKEWTSWNNAAKKILESDSTFGVNPNDITQYIVRDHEISSEEKYNNEFKSQKQFFARIDIIMKFVADDEADKDSDLFSDMYQYFTGFLKTITRATTQVVAAYLTVQKIGNLIPSRAYSCKYTFAQIYGDLKENEKIEPRNRKEDEKTPREVYEELKDTKNTTLKEDFLRDIKDLTEWQDEYLKLFPTVLKKELLDAVAANGGAEKLKKFAVNCYEDYKDFRAAILFFFENCQDDAWHKDSGVSYEKQLIAILNVIDLCFREIASHVNTTENKKVQKQAEKLLFDSEALANFMFSNGEETVTKMYTLVDDIHDLDPNIKSKLRNKILEKYPDYKFRTTEEKASAPKGMLVTAAKLEEKQALVEQIQKVDIPANAKEIGEARAQGDLKENAEYKAAKEHQHYLNVTLAKLQEELARAVVFDPTTASTAIVSFGTKVTLFNKDTNQNEVYTILGPWESDPDKGIISYMSPRGNELLNRKPEEEFSFKINETLYNYKVLQIEIAK
ncbi:MAG: transcription elongation factor GreA [Treponema sp.]|nr:transcription elongation factor GreA [Treponema sp.]